MNPLRRMFLRRAVGAAAFAPLAGNVMAEQLQGHAMSAALSAGQCLTVPATQPLGWRTQRAQSALRLAESGSRDNLMFRIGPFDPDVAALGSVSHSFKAGLQRRRDDRTRSFLERLRTRAWGS